VHIKKGTTHKVPTPKEFSNLNDPIEDELFEEEKEVLRQLREWELSKHFSDRFMMIVSFTCKLDVNRTKELLKKNWEWRSTNGFVNVPSFSEVPKDLITSDTFFIVPGTRSKKGQSLAYMQVRNFVPGQYTQEGLLKFLIWCWNEGFESERMDAFRNGVIIVQDMTDMGWCNIDMLLIKNLMQVAQEYFPHRVKKILLVNPPGIVKLLLKLASVFVHQKFMKAIEVITPEQILEFVDADVLPVKFGGNLEYGSQEYLQGVNDWLSTRETAGAAEMDSLD